MTPLISFIITYHNEPEALLRTCIESIQALPLAKDEAEIIVVDDGSSNQLIIKDEKLKIIRQEESGLSVARNTGISQSRGRYIQFVDADDCLIPETYTAVLKQVRKERADIVMFRMTSKNRSNCQTDNCQLIKSQSFLLHHSLRAAACGYAFRRDILGNLRFYPGLFHEDELFTPQLFLRAKSVCELNVKAYFYRQHDGTITHSNSPEKVQKRLDNIHFIIKELHSLDEKLLERRIRQLTVDYLQKTWTLTHSLRELHSRASRLRAEGLLPLPLRRYSMRYLFIALISKFI